jgi:hypothetical protein
MNMLMRMRTVDGELETELERKFIHLALIIDNRDEKAEVEFTVINYTDH